MSQTLEFQGTEPRYEEVIRKIYPDAVHDLLYRDTAPRLLRSSLGHPFTFWAGLAKLREVVEADAETDRKGLTIGEKEIFREVVQEESRSSMVDVGFYWGLMLCTLGHGVYGSFKLLRYIVGRMLEEKAIGQLTL